MNPWTDPNEPLLSCEEMPCPKRKRCLYCNKFIAAGDNSLAIRLFNWSSLDDQPCYMHENCIEPSGFSKNRERFINKSYSVEQFQKRLSLGTYKDMISNFDFTTALQNIVNPSWPALTEDFETLVPLYKSLSDLVQGKQRDDIIPWQQRNNGKYADLVSLLVILMMCGYGPKILDLMKGRQLPDHSWILFAMLDEPVFQQEVSALFALESLPEALNLLRKPKMTLSDILFAAKSGQSCERFMDVLVHSLQLYRLDYTHTFAPTRPPFTGFRMARNARLCYFFIFCPEKLPLFSYFLKTERFPIDTTGDFTYIESTYYRAAVLHLLLTGQKDRAAAWLDAMPTKVKYHPSGSPNGFIRETQKMFELFGSPTAEL